MPNSEPTIGDAVTQADFQSWKHHPVSKVFLRYLRDYAAMLEKDTLFRWKSGAKLADEQEALGRVRTLEELTELEFASIRNFYSSEDRETDGTETHQDGHR